MRLFSKQEIFLEHFVVFCVFSSDIHDISPLLFPSQVIFASSKKKAIYIPGGGDGTPTIVSPFVFDYYLLSSLLPHYHNYSTKTSPKKQQKTKTDN